ncbi:MAG: hypothetical protein Q8M43_01245 [Sulfuricurvum sp.]|uniref:hypothetical protein n=1 Tax=Sulfuricurvum sp. TaxID=2025608 RepID=UPI002734320D|nr:hypothetical protein [Sulfuricurvum sp.]MDP3290637.1 hypothetical protein [Sulfuricurvum sp.]
MKYKSLSIGEAVRILEEIEKERKCLLLGTALKPILRNCSNGAKTMISYKAA